MLADAVCFARDLINTPPSDLFPAGLAAAADAYGKKAGLTAEIMDEKALKKGGYGGILAVGQGSENKPRLVKLTYTHPKATKYDRAGRQGHHLRLRRPLASSRPTA